MPTTYNYQFLIQTRLSWNMVLDSAYVGTQARHLQDNRNLNYVPYGANFLRPLYGFNNVTLYENQSTSNCNGLQVALNRRASNGLFMGLTYTWSKVLTTASSDTASARVDQYQKLANHGPASFDVQQNFAGNFVYLIPGPYTGSSDPFNRLNASCFFAAMPGSLGLRVDAFNIVNHANFTRLSGAPLVLNFNAYPTGPGGVVTSAPTIANNVTLYNAAAQLVNVTEFGAATSAAAGAPGGPRALQLLARITF